jgi:hypothetical protein
MESKRPTPEEARQMIRRVKEYAKTLEGKIRMKEIFEEVFKENETLRERLVNPGETDWSIEVGPYHD